MTEYINPNASKHRWDSGLAEGSWKGMKKFLEQDRLCEALQGRVQYDFTWYPAFGGNSGIYTVLLDRKVVKKFGTGYAYRMLTRKGFKIEHLDVVHEVPLESRDEYTDFELSKALRDYRRQSIDLSIASDNPMIRMFAIVDRRIGKRRLEKLKDEIEQQPEWLRTLYLARMQAEGVIPSGE